MEKLTINIFMNPADFNLTMKHVPGKIPKNVEYITTGPNSSWDGITVFTDSYFDTENMHWIDTIQSKIKLAWIHEPRPLHQVQQTRYTNIERIINKFDYILTYDEYLLNNYPDNTIFTPDNGIWILDENIGLHKKTKLISMIYSFKTWTRGHLLRHFIADNIPGIDLYGDGSKHPVDLKEEGLVDYKYSITIENHRAKYYYTEKINDCLAVGTIPIYWGCTNIGDYYNTEGILQFERISDLEQIFDIISNEDHYAQSLPAIEDNLNRVKQCNILDDWIYENIYKTLLSEGTK